MRLAVAVVAGFAGLLVACIPAAAEPEAGPDAMPASAPSGEIEQRSAQVTPTPVPTAGDMRAGFSYTGELTQGGFIRGLLPSNTITASLDGEPLSFAADGRFFAGLDRNHAGQARLEAVLAGGKRVSERLAISPRNWNIERVNVARRTGGPSASFMARRRPELDAIWSAREKETDATGYTQDFIWPVKGRISGRFGSQRIYRGEPGSYHTGIDIAPGYGVPFVAPADGVVVLAVDNFSLEGKLLIIDHGAGLNSAFLHASKLVVKEGDVVKQGQHIGNIGSSGRATGPHLHWGLKWNNARLDPLLFAGPM